MTVRIIDLAAMRPGPSAGAGTGSAAILRGGGHNTGASFDAALALRRAATANGGALPRAATRQGEAAAHANVPAGTTRDHAHTGHALPPLLVEDADGQQQDPKGTTPAVSSPASDKALSETSADESLAAESLVGLVTDTVAPSARPDSLQPATARQIAPPAETDHTHAQARPGAEAEPAMVRSTALSGVMTTVAGTAAPVAEAMAGGTVKNHMLSGAREQTTPRAGTAHAVRRPGRQPAASGEQGADAPLEAGARRATARRTGDSHRADQLRADPRDTFVLARGAVTADGRAPAGESVHIFPSAAPTAPAATATGVASVSSPLPNAPAFTAQLDAPVGGDEWNRALRQQSLRLSHFGDGRAELTLHPRELGQIQVSLKMGEQAQLHFAAPNAQVRAAVEAALPQLRHAFAESGLDLGQASVSDQGNPRFGSERQPQSSRGGFADPVDETLPAPVSVTRIAGRTPDGGIDIFA